MSKRKKAGNTDKFKPGKQGKLPPNVGAMRNSDRTSPKVSRSERNIPRVDSACYVEEINISADFLTSPGRQWGDVVLYDPEQLKNFPSQYARYVRGLDMQPDLTDVDNVGGKFWEFCGDDGYRWRVTLEPELRELNLQKPILFIICPRPFELNELAGLDTNLTDGQVKWSQLEGRRTLIQSEEAINPTIHTIGQRDPLEPPIQLLVEAVDDKSVFDIQVIYPFAVSLLPPVSPQSPIYEGGRDCARVDSYYLTPKYQERAYKWQGEPLQVGWLPPECDRPYLQEYAVAANTEGSYAPVQRTHPGDDLKFTLAANTAYRVNSVYAQGGIDTYSLAGERVAYFYGEDFPLHLIFGDDTLGQPSGSSPVTDYSKTVFEKQIRRGESDVSAFGLSPVTDYHTLAIEVTTVGGFSESVLDAIAPVTGYSKVDTGGVIIG